MKSLDFDWQIDEFMVYCRSTQLREKTMQSYEQTLRLFERWANEEMHLWDVDKVTEQVIRRYINDLQERGKYTFYANEELKKTNNPDRRRDFRKPISITTINNYIRNLWVFFNWLDREYIIKRNPIKKFANLKPIGTSVRPSTLDGLFCQIIKNILGFALSIQGLYAIILQ